MHRLQSGKGINAMIWKTKSAVRVSTAGLLLASALASAAAAQEVEDGRRLAENLCQRCHAIGESGESANSEAPPFREIAGRYSIWSLQEALAEGILVGHPDMPQFTLGPDEINALLSYWDTLTPARAKE